MALQPNIIFFLSDQHNAEISGFAGDPFVRTPNIDKIASSGVVLDKCYCASPLCIPSRSALLSGQMPWRTGMYNNMQSLRSDIATLPMALSVGGYETVLAGRMHFSGPDQRHGFLHRLVGDITPSQIGVDNEDTAFGIYRGASGQNTSALTKSGYGRSPTIAYDEDVVAAACDWIRNYDKPKPVFMIVGTYGPHCPYAIEEDLYKEYYDTFTSVQDVSQEYRRNVHPAIRKWYRNRNLEMVNPEDLRRVRAAYYGMITKIDSQVGEVYQAAMESFGAENTIFIYGSDHGDCIGKHGLFWKTNFYEGSARVPMMYSWKGHIPAGVRFDTPTSLLDIAPTLLHLADCPALPLYDGVNLSANLLSGALPDKERVVFAECYDIKGDNPSVMARDNRWKLTLHAGYSEPQLFDLDNDKNEDQDLGTNPEYAQEVQRLSAYLTPFWNPKKALDALDRDKKHYDIVRKFAAIAKPEPIEEWSGDLCSYTLNPPHQK